MTTSDDRIRLKAYQLWEARGRPLGSAEIDWYEAEQLLQAQLAPAAASETPPEGVRRYGLRRLDRG